MVGKVGGRGQSDLADFPCFRSKKGEVRCNTKAIGKDTMTGWLKIGGEIPGGHFFSLKTHYPPITYRRKRSILRFWAVLSDEQMRNG